jgi:hypothetical protein
MTRKEATRRWQTVEADGVGLVLGDGWGGLDLDECRDPKTGKLDPRAEAVLDLVPGARVEVSPSGKGVKLVGRAARWLELTFRDSVSVRSSDSGYFTVTGVLYREGAWDAEVPVDAIAEYFGTPAARAEAKVSKTVPTVVNPGSQNSTMFAEMCALRRRGYKDTEVAALVWEGVQSGRYPAEQGKDRWSRREVDQMAQRVCARYPAGDDDFTKNDKGVPHPTPENIRRAFRALAARPRLDRFSQQHVVEREGRSALMSDEVMRRLFFECGEALNFRPPRALFHEVAYDMAALDDFHPVRDYLADLEWDGVPRVDAWLHTYAGAEDTPYSRAVGKLVAVAAVRRVRQPGCKFDELLVLESQTQGLDKSNLLRKLCPNSEWFSESLSLATDSKVVIERTSGVWIAEAAEMVGSGKDIDRLKSFLSTSTDGPVRLAYAREPVKVPRQFVVVGTTNHGQYLRDMTGNRRFWPVAVGRIDLELVARDRDQIWAEAAHMEEQGESIRLDRALWEAAGEEQEKRRVTDPWEELLLDAFGNADCVVSSRRVWREIGVPVDRRTQEDNERLSAVTRRLGFERCTFKERGTGEVRRGYRRGTQRVGLLEQMADDDQGGL